MNLKNNLCIAAIESGNPIMVNRGGKHRHFRCSCQRNQKFSSTNITSKNSYRNTSLVNNDKGNRRQNGKEKPRRSKTRDQSRTCPFIFSVSWDTFGFFVALSRRSGNPHHQHHPKPDNSIIPSIPTRLLSNQQKEETLAVMRSSSNNASGRNYLFTTTGRFLHRVKLAYLERKSKGDTGLRDDIDSMIDNFENSQEVKFTTLCDVPLSELTSSGDDDLLTSITMSTIKDDNGNIVNTPVKDIPSLAALGPLAKSERVRRQLSVAQYLFISIAWTVLPVFRFFMLCPEVIWCDVTSHSNNKGFHLLTFSCRTSLDKQVVFLYIWIPNEQRISFRWCFQHAIPNLIPQYIRERVLFIMKDGDPQQRNEILYALLSVFPNAKEGGCGWHIGTIHYYHLLQVL